jgi:AbrB family looped-hinge helix DNA binding protein
MKETTITHKGQIVIPAEIRRKYHIRPGQKFSVHDVGGEIRLVPLKTLSVEEAKGWLKTKRTVSGLLKQARKLEREREGKIEELLKDKA